MVLDKYLQGFFVKIEPRGVAVEDKDNLLNFRISPFSEGISRVGFAFIFVHDGGDSFVDFVLIHPLVIPTKRSKEAPKISGSALRIERPYVLHSNGNPEIQFQTE